MSEFSMVKNYFEPLGFTSKYVRIEIGDDAALIDVPEGYELVTAGDTLVEDVHFPKDFSAYDMAYRSLATNLSDVAAMGAEPIGYLLQVCMNAEDENWLKGFCEGLKEAAQGIPLIGGDTTKSALTVICITTYGVIKKGDALTRSGANIDDDIYVTGVLGQGAKGLKDYLAGNTVTESAQHFVNPGVPRIFAQGLSTLASSCIDISDGFDGDIKHLLNNSWVGAIVHLDKLPIVQLDEVVQLGETDELVDLAETEIEQHNKKEHALEYALFGGDDYQLCFTAPKSSADAIFKLAKDTDTQVTYIGNIEKGSELSYKKNGHTVEIKGKSYEHFA